MSNIWEKPNYRANIHFLIDVPIREFDISKANISVLRDANVLSEDQYQYYLQCPKMEREIAIGKLQGAQTEITKILKDGIAQARMIFIQSNGIRDDEILSIRNDSVTVIGNKPINTLQITSRVLFREAGKYTSYYHLGVMDFLYYANMIENVENLSIKGLKGRSLELHKEYMLDLLSELFYTAQFEGVKVALSLLSGVYQDYVSKKFPIQYYRELNSRSMYKLKGFSEFSTFYMEVATETEKPIVDISYNSEILRQLNRMFASVYFGTK